MENLTGQKPLSGISADPILNADAIEYYWDRCCECVYDNIIVPARQVLWPDLEITRHQRDAMNAISKYNRVGIQSGHGCLSAGTMVLMADGSEKKACDIKVGDRLIQGDGKRIVTVKRLFRGRQKMYRVRYKNGEYYDVNASHKLALVATNSNGKQKTGKKTNVTVSEYLGWSKERKRTNVGYKSDVSFFCGEKRDLEIDPYILGLWLGDGSSGDSAITTMDREVKRAWLDDAFCRGLKIKRVAKKGKAETIAMRRKAKRNTFKDDLRSLRLLGNKHIPHKYKISSYYNRLQLLAGIIDSDGYLCRGSSYDYITARYHIAKDVVFLARSVGLNATAKSSRKRCQNNGVWGDYWRVSITRNIEKLPCRVKRRKANTKRKIKRSKLNYSFSIEPLGYGDYYGWENDGDHTFLLSDFTATNNTGKSSVFSWIGFWYLATRQNSLGYSVKCPVIAPTFHQLYDIIWPEFKRWLPISRFRLLFTINQTEVYRNGLKDLVWARARSPKIPAAIQGNHAQHLLWIADEGFGITDDLVWETVEGSITEDDNKILFGGQHTVLHGFCHDAFTRDSEFWKLLTFSSVDSPIAKKEYSDRIARKYGRNSDIYRVRVLGLAPKGDPDAFISLERAEEARCREVPINGRLDAGIDPARFGDDLTTCGLKRGNHVFTIDVLAQSDTDQICNLFLQKLRKYRKEYKDDQICYVKVDATGGYGAGVIDQLNKNITDNIEVIPVYFSGRVSKETNDEYYDGCSIMWGELRDQIDYLGLPDDDDLIEEVSTRKFAIGNDNRTKIQSKAEYKKKYESSPDRADCLVLMCTQKAGIDRVFPYYRATDPKHRTFKRPSFDKALPGNFRVFGSLFLSKTYGLYGGAYFWGRKSKRLVVYNELIEPNPVSTIVAREYRKKLMLPLVAGGSGRKVEKIFGNDEFFSGGTDFELQLRKSHVRVKQLIRYDRAGAVFAANRMFRKGQVAIHWELEETDHQFRMWRKENGKFIDGFPLCEAFLHVVAELRDTGELDDDSGFEPEPYSKEKQNMMDKLRDLAPDKRRRKEREPQFDDFLLR